MMRRGIARSDLWLRPRLPFLKTRGGRAAFAVVAVIGILSTGANFFDPGAADASQLAAVTGLFFAAILFVVTLADVAVSALLSR
jgi:hypothetical protein